MIEPVVDDSLSRLVVGFGRNKSLPLFRLFPFREGFSTFLVETMLSKYGIDRGVLLDPFCGGGTAPYVATKLGMQGVGMEIHPVARLISDMKNIPHRLSESNIMDLSDVVSFGPDLWESQFLQEEYMILRTTKGAYPRETARSIRKYRGYCLQYGDLLGKVLDFALLCVLESVSYTRKDGQFLRWDSRSRHGRGKFCKGEILDFNDAIRHKLVEVRQDIHEERRSGREVFKVLDGSCLDLLPKRCGDSVDCVFTSPPYLNRYDYTRTYALELAMLGYTDEMVGSLRQRMLSATVENRPKDLSAANPEWSGVVNSCLEDEHVSKVLSRFSDGEVVSSLNNKCVPRMVRGYFTEMACVIHECCRSLRSGGYMFMVNDDVQYSGVHIPVGVILSSLAEKSGFEVDSIRVLPRGKGNSSQQMGKFGRKELHKCVCVWRKP